MHHFLQETMKKLLTYINNIPTPSLWLSHDFCLNIFYTYWFIFANILQFHFETPQFYFTNTHTAVRLAQVKKHKSKPETLICVCMCVCINIYI